MPGQWGSQTERFLSTFLHVASPRHNQMPGICLHMPGRARLLTATVSSFNNHDMLHLLTPQHSHSGELYCQRHYPGTAEWLNSWGSIKGHFSYKSRAVGPVSHHTHAVERRQSSHRGRASLQGNLWGLCPLHPTWLWREWSPCQRSKLSGKRGYLHPPYIQMGENSVCLWIQWAPIILCAAVCKEWWGLS